MDHEKRLKHWKYCNRNQFRGICLRPVAGGRSVWENLRLCRQDESCWVIPGGHIDSLTKSNIKIDKLDLPTFYWLPKLHKNPYKSRFISNSSHCSTTILSKHITSALTTVKDHVIKYSETAFSNSNVNYFWSIKNSSEVIEKLRLRNFQGSQVSSFDFSTLYTSLPHDLIKAKVLSLIKAGPLW